MYFVNMFCIFIQHYEGDVTELSLDFTVTEDIRGKLVTTELKPGGKDIPVTNDNKLQYVYAISDYKLNRQVSNEFVISIFFVYASHTSYCYYSDASIGKCIFSRPHRSYISNMVEVVQCK